MTVLKVTKGTKRQCVARNAKKIASSVQFSLCWIERRGRLPSRKKSNKINSLIFLFFFSYDINLKNCAPENRYRFEPFYASIQHAIGAFGLKWFRYY